MVALEESAGFQQKTILLAPVISHKMKMIGEQHVFIFSNICNFFPVSIYYFNVHISFKTAQLVLTLHNYCTTQAKKR